MTINTANNKRDLIYITNDGQVKYDHAIIMKQAAEYIKEFAQILQDGNNSF